MTIMITMTMWVTAILSVSLYLSVAVSAGSSTNGNTVTSKFQITIPKSLTKSDGYDHRDSLFGIPPYGGSISQQVFYTKHKLCDSTVDTTDGYPSTNGKSWPPPFILMVDRGDCTFVHKVRNAQRAGAAAVIIADDSCLCSDDKCTPEEGTNCEDQEPIMADDGSGADISIPSFLLFKTDSDAIKKALLDNQQVRATMSFAIPSANSRVEYDLYTTPKDELSRPFLESFLPASLALDSKAYFTPHMYIYDGVRAGCHVSNGDNFCYNLCTNAGRYCATDPDDDLDQGISGADVVTESLRRMCIWKKYGVSDGIGKEWWEYVKEFMFRCDNPTSTDLFFTSEKCITDAMEHAGVDKTIIDACMSESGGLTGNGTNVLLQQAIAKQTATGIVLVPSMFINQAPVRGSLSFSTVFKAICAGFAQGSEPPICSKCANCPNEEDCVTKGFCHGPGSANLLAESGVSMPAFIGIVCSVVFCLCGVSCCIYKRQQRLMRDQVRGIMAEYMPIDERQKRGFDTSLGGIPDTPDDDDDGHGSNGGRMS